MKSHCPHGHAMTEENVYRYPNGKRSECKTCRQTRRDRHNGKQVAVPLRRVEPQFELCSECMASFVPYRPQQKTCGEVCRRALKLRMERKRRGYDPETDVWLRSNVRKSAEPRIPGLPCSMEPYINALADWGIRYEPV